MSILKPTSNDEYQRMFDEASSDPNRIVIVDFKTAWCKVCTIMKPELEEFTKQNSNVTIIEFDMEELDHEDMEGVRVPPTFKFFKAGAFMTAFAGRNMAKMSEVVKGIDTL